jgi:hypothetical protein
VETYSIKLWQQQLQILQISDFLLFAGRRGGPGQGPILRNSVSAEKVFGLILIFVEQITIYLTVMSTIPALKKE